MLVLQGDNSKQEGDKGNLQPLYVITLFKSPVKGVSQKERPAYYCSHTRAWLKWLKFYCVGGSTVSLDFF
jgi:hypothetical protein